MSSALERRDEESSALDAARGRDKRAYVRAMFSQIAPRYDLLNHLLSFNVDRRWRRLALRELKWELHPVGTYLDLCAGTLDVADQLSRTRGFAGRVIGADFAEPMLRKGQGKVAADRVSALASDALALPLASGSMSGAIVAFGMRNLADLEGGLREVARVLRRGSRFVILEFSMPKSSLVRGVYGFYFEYVLPLIGGALSGNRGAYRYLPESVAHFPSEAVLADLMRRTGFRDVSWHSLTLGVAAIHVGTR